MAKTYKQLRQAVSNCQVSVWTWVGRESYTNPGCVKRSFAPPKFLYNLFMLKKILLTLAVILVLFLGYAAMQPASFKIERSTFVAAPAKAAFDQVEDFRKWEQWSPWEKLDPSMKKEYSGPEKGVGAGYSWVGNREVGEGRMTMTQIIPPSLIEVKLEFIKPMAATNMTTFSFVPDQTGTRVTWTMTGNHNFVGKIFGVLIDMDKMVGADFEKGLNGIKTLAETSAK